MRSREELHTAEVNLRISNPGYVLGSISFFSLEDSEFKKIRKEGRGKEGPVRSSNHSNPSHVLSFSFLLWKLGRWDASPRLK